MIMASVDASDVILQPLPTATLSRHAGDRHLISSNLMGVMVAMLKYMCQDVSSDTASWHVGWSLPTKLATIWVFCQWNAFQQMGVVHAA